MSETVKTKDIPAHIPLLAAGFHMAPKSTGSRWLAWDALASACSETDDLDYASVAESVRSAAPVYAAAPELLAMLEEMVEQHSNWDGEEEPDTFAPARVRNQAVRLQKRARTLIATVKGETNE